MEGRFDKGEVVSLIDPAGIEFARGLTNYDSPIAANIAGKRTGDVKQILGGVPYVEVIHRDNLVVTR